MTIDLSKVDRAVEQATKQTVLKFSAYISLEWITKPRDWGTRYGTRDIVDTGQLRASQRVEETNVGWRIYWTAEHALYVHEGFILAEAMPRRKMTGRPFARLALENFDFNAEFERQFKKAIG